MILHKTPQLPPLTPYVFGDQKLINGNGTYSDHYGLEDGNVAINVGGGILAVNDANLNIYNVTIQNNTSASGGGGIYI